MNIFDQAMKFEQKGMHYYHGLAKRAWDPAMKRIFTWLALQEEQHFRLLRSMKKVGTIPAMRKVNFRPILRLLKMVGREMVVAEITLSQISAYRTAIKMENQSEKFYRRRAQQAGRGPVRRTLLAIAVEEAKHADTIEYILDGMEKARKAGSGLSRN